MPFHNRSAGAAQPAFQQPAAAQPAQQQSAPPPGRFGNRGAAPAAAAQPAQQQAPQGPRDELAGYANAPLQTHRLPYLRAGEYILRVLKFERKETRAKEIIYFIESEVIVSTFDPNASPQSNPEGSQVSIGMNNNDSLLTNLKSFMYACKGPSDGLSEKEQVDEVKYAYGPEQPLAGVLFFVRARDGQTKAGNAFTFIDYFPVKLLPDGSPDMNSLGQL